MPDYLFKSFLFTIFFIAGHAVIAQSINNTFHSHYSSEEYGGSFSNWRVSQNHLGLIHVTNLSGYLELDSKNWKSILTDPTTIIELSIDDSVTLIGTVGDLGYISADSIGNLTFNSLKSKIYNSPSFDSSFMNFDREVIWDVTLTGHNLYFYTKKAVYHWDGKDIKAWNGIFTTKLKALGNKVYSNLQGRGIMEFHNTDTSCFISAPDIDRLLFLDSIANDLILVTTNNGVLKYQDDNLVNLSTEVKRVAQTSSIFSFIKLNISPDLSYAFSTPSSGVYLLDENFKITNTITSKTGLAFDVIKQMHLDNQQNLWLAGIGGISKLEIASPWHFWTKSHELTGAAYGVKWYNDELLIGSTEGLFVLDEHHIKKINSLKVWTLLNYNNQLMILAEDGLYQSMGNTIKRIGAGGSYAITTKNNSIIQDAQGIGIIRLRQAYDGTFLKETLIEKKGLITSSIVEDSTGTIWIATKSDGIYQYKPSGEYVLHDSIDVRENAKLALHKSQLYLATAKALYRFEGSKFKPIFQHDNISFTTIGSNKLGLLLGVKEGNQYKMRLLSYDTAGNKYNLEGRQFNRPEFGEIINFDSFGDSVIFVSTSKGLYKYNVNNSKNIDFQFNTLIRKVEVNDSAIFNGHYSTIPERGIYPILTHIQPQSLKPVFESYDNNFIFEYACTSYEAADRNEYSYYLKNNDKDWSKWSTDTKKEYTNLPAGEYTFMVKAKNIYDNEGEIASYSFTILPPWYQTIWAYMGFFVLAVLFIWFVSLIYTYRIRMHRRKLKLIVADRTFEVIQQKKEIESQNDLLKKQNSEIILQKEEIQEKNAELQTSQEEILTINEQLKELNLHLEKKVDQRTRKIKATVEKLKKVNQELDTFVYRASHDLKGPISRIHGLTSLAKLESTAETDQKYYELIERAALDMQGLLSKLSNAYEIMSKQLVAEKIDIPFLLSEIRNSIKFLDHGTKYSFDIAEQLTLVTDMYLLKLIIENLIENALIFRKPESRHEINIKCSEADGFFYFQIVDNGIGVNPEHYEQIYHMFFRGSDKSKGSGLGLYIVKAALEKLRGEITLDSTLYQYTSFTVKIPLN